MKKFMYLTFAMLYIFTTGFSQDFNGKWKFETDIEGMGNIQFLFDFEQTSDSTFSASSREGALKDVVKEAVGGLKYAVIKKKLDGPNSILIKSKSGEIKKDSLIGVFATPMGNFDFKARVQNDLMTGNLSVKDTEVYFDLKGVPHPENCLDIDYVSLCDDIEKTFHDNIYNNRVLKKKEWKRFFKRLDYLAPKTCDDLEMFTYFSFLSGQIKMSHIYLLKYNQWDDYDETDTTGYEPQVSHKLLDETTAYIKFESFQLADTTVVSTFFKTIVSEKVPNLIFDFRGCTGGDYSSMFLAEYLVNESHDAGFFIGNKYFQNHKKIPDAETVKSIPYYDGKSLKDFLKVIETQGLLRGNIVPNKETQYSGKVYALIDNRSMSATEPISYFLKYHKLATLVGETTAGEMLSANYITVKDGWNLVLPVADYYTSDRYRIEQKGVTPDVRVKSEDALDYVLKIIAR